MSNRADVEASILISGRYFSLQDLLEAVETVRMFPRLSRRELALTICENLDWLTPAGKYKTASCSQLLNKLEAQGLITLPDKRTEVNQGVDSPIEFSEHTQAGKGVEGALSDLGQVYLEPLRCRDAVRRWNEYVHRYHVLGYKRPFGAHQRYFIRSDLEPGPLGCLLFAASAWALEARDEWIGWTKTDRSLRLNLIVNNTRFLIFPWVRIKNLASKTLSLAVKRIGADWQARYGYSPVLLETFVDPEKYRGTSYRAANWTYLGQTKGRGRMDRYKKRAVTRKDIYVYPLADGFRFFLKGEDR